MDKVISIGLNSIENDDFIVIERRSLEKLEDVFVIVVKGFERIDNV